VEFEWDPAKAASNEHKHDVPFAAAIDVFLDIDRVDVDVTREADGERRRKVIGQVRGRLLSLVYTVREDRIRVISARPSNPQEMKRYGHR
jgi:uncharacterized DUF497 family protein